MIEAGGRDGAVPRPSIGRSLLCRLLVVGAASAIAALAVAPANGAGPDARAHIVTGAPQHKPLIARFQLLARLRTKHPAWATPDPHGRLLAIIHPRRPLTGAQTVLPVITEAQGSDGQPWLEVRLPGRPLHGQLIATTGWIAAEGTVPGRTPWHIVINTARRRASVFKHGHQVRRFSVIVGKPSTPTPIGAFFVEESVAVPANAVGAPYALATSARSNALQEFAGGPGQIALHSVRNIGGTLGTAASHGCIRFAVRAIRWLAAHIPPGTPVTIV